MVETSLSSGVLPSRQRLLYELYPRALPPVTQSSALQAPECLRGNLDVSVLSVVEKESRGQVFILVYRLAMDAKTRKGDGGAD